MAGVPFPDEAPRAWKPLANAGTEKPAPLPVPGVPDLPDGDEGKASSRRTRKALKREFLERAGLPRVRRAGRMDPEVAGELLAYVRAGGAVTEFARASGLAYGTVVVWMMRHQPGALAKAREEGCEALAEHVLRLVSTPYMAVETTKTVDALGRVTVTQKTKDAVDARKLAAWGCLELMKAWSPDRFGKRVTVEAGSRMAEAIATARGRVDGSAVRDLRGTPADVVDVTPNGKIDATGVNEAADGLREGSQGGCSQEGAGGAREAEKRVLRTFGLSPTTRLAPPAPPFEEDDEPEGGNIF